MVFETKTQPKWMWIGISIIAFVALFFFITSVIILKESTKKQEKVIYCEFGLPPEELKTSVGKYEFLPVEISDYICLLGEQLEIDTDLAVSILLKENPQLITEAMHKNTNGTIDVGLWQLNDKYLWSKFVPKYWQLESEFDPFNWKMNTFIALHLISDLTKSLKVNNDIIMAYNCGTTAVMTGNIPPSTISYLASVNINYKMLKKGENE